MDEPSLAGVWAKQRRAEAHFERLELEIRSFFDGDLGGDRLPLAVSRAKLDPDEWYVAYALVEREPSPELGVTLGDAIHDLRSSLDQLVWQLVLLNDETPRDGGNGNSWPFASSKSGWEKAKRTSLLGVSDLHKALIRKGQPYTAGDRAQDSYPALLQHLSNVDKHQIVHPMAVVLQDPGDAIEFKVVAGPGKPAGKAQFRTGQALDHQAPLLRERIIGATDETQVDVEGDVPVGIAFSERRIRWDAIKNVPYWVAAVLRTFEPDFPQSRSRSSGYAS